MLSSFLVWFAVCQRPFIRRLFSSSASPNPTVKLLELSSLSSNRVSILPPYHHRHHLRTLAVSILLNSINRPICVPAVTIHCPCSSTWVVLDRELCVLVLVLVFWLRDTSLLNIGSLCDSGRKDKEIYNLYSTNPAADSTQWPQFWHHTRINVSDTNRSAVVVVVLFRTQPQQ